MCDFSLFYTPRQLCLKCVSRSLPLDVHSVPNVAVNSGVRSELHIVRAPMRALCASIL